MLCKHQKHTLYTQEERREKWNILGYIFLFDSNVFFLKYFVLGNLYH